MKKSLFTIGLMLMILIQCFAQTSSSVVVFSQDGQRFWVIFNGIKQNDTPQTNVKVTGLIEPNYKMKIIFQDETIPSIDKMVYTKDYDGKYFNVTYVVKKDKKGKLVAQMNSYDQAQPTTTGQYSTPLTLQDKPETTTTNPAQTQDNKQNVTTQTTTVNKATTDNPGGGGVNVDIVDPVTGQKIKMDVKVNETGASVQTQQTTTTITTTTTTTSDQKKNAVQPVNTVQPVNNTTPAKPDHYVMPGYNGKIGCPWPMAESDFSSAKQSISSKSFEDDKLTIAKQVLGSNCMTCDQIKNVMGVFSFEDSKIEFAKYAYGYVYDPGNYYKINDAFTFSSSIDELNEYLKTKK